MQEYLREQAAVMNDATSNQVKFSKVFFEESELSVLN